MKVMGIGWVGVRTNNVDGMVDLFRDTMNMQLEEHSAGLAVFRLPSGALVDVFGPPTEGGEEWDALARHFTTGPVPGFWVADFPEAREALAGAGVELLGGIHKWGDYYSQHFRGPDGNVYEIFTDTKFKVAER